MKFGSILVGAVALALAAAPAHVRAQALYGASAAGATGELYVLNAANGALVQDVGPLNNALGTNFPVTGLAFSPVTGLLYGSTGNNPAATSAMLVSINPATALVSVIGPFNAGPVNAGGTPATMADIAFDAAGNLYGVGSIGGPQLYSINIATGQATVIGSTGLTSTTGGGLAISPGGIAYGTPTASRFGTYNLLTGAYTDIGNPTKPNGGGYGALEFNGDTLLGLNVGSGSPPPTALVMIDPATAGVTNLGASVASVDAIAFQVPEPSAAALLLLAGAGVAVRRRARRPH